MSRWPRPREAPPDHPLLVAYETGYKDACGDVPAQPPPGLAGVAYMRGYGVACREMRMKGVKQ